MWRLRSEPACETCRAPWLRHRWQQERKQQTKHGPALWGGKICQRRNGVGHHPLTLGNTSFFTNPLFAKTAPHVPAAMLGALIHALPGGVRAFALPLPSRIRDAVPLRWGMPKEEDGLDVMIVGLCPTTGDGLVRCQWKWWRVTEKEYLVHRGLPGEIVTMKFGIVRALPYPHGEFQAFILPDVTKYMSSKWEIKSPCPHYEACGGCDFLNLKYGRQLIEKQRWVQKALAKAMARADRPVMARIRPSEPQSRFEHRTEWVFSEQDGMLRFGPIGSDFEEEPPSACLLAPRSAIRLLTEVFFAFKEARHQTSQTRAALMSSASLSRTGQRVPTPTVFPGEDWRLFGGYSVYEEKRGRGIFKSIVVIATRPPKPPQVGADETRAGRAMSTEGVPASINGHIDDGKADLAENSDAEGDAKAAASGEHRWLGTELLLNIVLAKEIDSASDLLDPLVRAAKAAAGPQRLVGVVANIARAKRDVMGGRREMLLLGRRYARQAYRVHIGGISRDFVLHLGAGSRLPVHTRSLAEVARTVVEACELRETDVVWHCYCGGGEFTLALGVACEHVVAIGASATEVSELKRNLAANEIRNTTAVLTNLRSPWSLRQLSFHITQSQQRRLLLGSGEEQAKARDYALTTFVPGESRRRQIQRLSSAPFTAPLLREDALAQRELRVLLPAFVRDFRPSRTTLPVIVRGTESDAEQGNREVPPEMESRLKRLYRRLALKYHPDKNPDDPEASDRFQALTRAYKALVGDSAGPEEDDHLVQDPFKVAQASSYRPKFKDRWRVEGGEKHRIGGSGKDKEEEGSLDEEGINRTVRGNDVGAGAQEVAEDDDEEEDKDFAVNMEIDDTWAGGAEPAETPEMKAPPSRRIEDSASKIEEIVLREGADGLSLSGDGAAVPTLLPPDVIVVSQPRARKAGRGTPRHFQTWLRSTAVRAIVYIAVDAEAFAADLERLEDLGYRVRRIQPFDPQPHRRGILLVARLELLRPLAGTEEYGADGDPLLVGAPHTLLPGGERRPLLGGGGYVAIPARS